MSVLFACASFRCCSGLPLWPRWFGDVPKNLKLKFGNLLAVVSSDGTSADFFGGHLCDMSTDVLFYSLVELYSL